MNFKCGFRVQVELVKGPREGISRFGPVEAKAQVLQPTREQQQARLRFLARLSSTNMARVAAERLLHLSTKSGDNMVSVEHICVSSGMDDGILQGMRDIYAQMLQTNKGSLVSGLSSRLEGCLCRSEDAVTDGELSKVHAEISKFTDQCSRLLDLSYCVVPHLEKKPPSQWVPEQSVCEEALSSLFAFARSTQLRTRRLLEYDERERLARSRVIMMPTAWATSFLTL